MILGRGTQCASKWPCRLYDDRDLVRKRAQDAIDRCLAIDPVYDLLDQVKLGPVGASGDHIGFNADHPVGLFDANTPEMRNNVRFVKLCARYGLVEYWLELQIWPDCVDEVPYDFRAEFEKYRDYPKDEFLV